MAFLGWWLTARTGQVIPARAVFSAFKRYTQAHDGGELAVLADLSAAAERYEALDAASRQPPGASQAPTVSTTLETFSYRVDTLGLEVLKPLIIWLQDPSLGEVPAGQRDRLVAAVESWMVRRALVKEPSTGMHRFVVERLLREVAAAPAQMGERAETLLAAQSATVSYWPDDDELRTALLEEPVYRTFARARLRMVLEAVEDQRRGYPSGHRRAEAPVPRGTCSIEHLLPQQWRTSWDEGLDEAAAARRDVLLHTLGNLTLVTQSLNSSLSNSSWSAKRASLESSSSLLSTREVLRDHPQTWTDVDIQERTAALVEDLLAIWPAPEGHVHRGRLRARVLSEGTVTVKELSDRGYLSEGDQLVGAAEGDGICAPWSVRTAAWWWGCRLQVPHRCGTGGGGSGRRLRVGLLAPGHASGTHSGGPAGRPAGDGGW